MDGSILRHTFYRKECSTDLVILQMFPLPAAAKRSTLFAEILRRVMAIDPETWREEGSVVIDS